MSIQDCLAKITAYAADSKLKISKERLEMFAAQLEQQAKKALSQDEFEKLANKLFAEEVDRSFKIQKAERRSDLAWLVSAQKSISEGKLGGKDGVIWGKKIVEDMANYIHGGAVSPSEAGRLDPVAIGAQTSSDLRNFWDRGAKQFQDIFEKRLLIDEIFQERDAINNGIKPGVSGSKEAAEIAKHMFATSNEIFDLKKAYNPEIEKASDFLANRFWLREKVADVSKEEMAAFWEQNFSKSYPDTSPEERALIFGSIYDRITTGTYGEIGDAAVAGNILEGKGPRADILRRMAQSRTLLANDWRAEAEAFKKFGPETVGDLMGRVIDRAGKDVGILNKFRSNYEENWKKLYDLVYLNASVEDRQALKSAKPKLDGIFGQVTGAADAPALNNAGKIVKGLTNLEYAARTNLSFLRMIADHGLAPGLVKALTGESFMVNTVAIGKAYTKAFINTDFREQAMNAMLIYSGSAKSSIIGGLGAPGTDGGFLGNLAQKIGVLGFHRRHVEAMKVGIATVIQNYLAGQVEKDFSSLSGRFQKGLLSYGIDESKWKFYTNATESFSDQGVFSSKFLTPEGIRAAPEETVIQYMKDSGLAKGNATPPKEAIDFARHQLQTSLAQMINDHADYGSTSPRSKQKAFMYQGRDINDNFGAILRVLHQFKGASYTTLDGYRRIYNADGGSRGNWAGVAQAMAAVTFWWGLGDYVKNELTGKTHEDPLSPKFGMKALAASGGLGILSDAVLGMSKDDGVAGLAEGGIAALAGPVVGDVAGAAAIGVKTVEAAYKNAQGKRANYPGRQAISYVESLVPGHNLYGADSALNYYVLNGFKEFADHGYLRNLEQDARKNGQSYNFFKPTESVRLIK